jgi:hypothetical protein
MIPNENNGGVELPPEELEIMPDKTEKKDKTSQPAVKKEKGGSVLLQKIGLSLLFLLIGALAVALALYLPTATRLREAQTEVERLTAVEEEYITLQADYSLASRQSAVYKAISSMGLLESALLSKDSTRINQQLRYVQDDLERLKADDFAEVQQRLTTQFSKVRSSAANDPAAAINELRALLNDLLLYADTLE